MTRLGVIADTHDYLDPMVPEIFDGVQAILHAGDVESIEVIEKLEEIAPVIAVAGNHESPEVTKRYPWITTAEFDGVKIALTHQLPPLSIPDMLPMGGAWIKSLGIENAKAVVFGHNHEPINTKLGGVLYFNPGFAGPPKMEPLRTVGILEIIGTNITGEVYFLNEPPGEFLKAKAKRWIR